MLDKEWRGMVQEITAGRLVKEVSITLLGSTAATKSVESARRKISREDCSHYHLRSSAGVGRKGGQSLRWKVDL